MSTTTLRETLFATTPTAEPGGRINVRIIDAGWGSSGFYPAEALETAARDKVFPAGTHMYLDHPGVSEGYDRPERTLRDLAAVLTEDARYDPATKALVAPARVFEQWRKPLSDMADSIGVSIRASAEGDVGDVEGRAGFVIQRLVEAISVDFVTKAGRGGKVLEVFESARATGRAIERGVAEATANDRREQLQAILRDAYKGDGPWVYLRDFDDTTVWFEVEGGDENGLYQQAYSVTDDVATALTGDRVEVRIETSYVPVTPTTSASEAATSVPSRPAGQSTTQEDPMGTTQIEESELTALREGAGRATALETERDQAKTELAEAHRLADEAIAARVIAEADVEFDELQTAGLVASAPRVAESGRLDVDAFTTKVTEHAARLAEAQGAGTVRGFGNTTSTTPATDQVTESQLDAVVGGAFGRPVQEA